MVIECVFENCSRTFDKQWKLEEHICSHTGDRPFLCDESGCDKSFVRKSHLQRHLLSHSDERPHSCTTCTSTFKTKANLNKHQLTHTGKKPFVCHVAECDATFLKKTQLYRHLSSVHQITTPFTCAICQHSFTTQSHLTRHEGRQHYSEFMCTDCYEKFDKFSALQKHISRNHKRRPRCSQCSLSFSSQTNLNSHVRTVHMTPDSGAFCSSSQSSVEFRTEVVGAEEEGATEHDSTTSGGKYIELSEIDDSKRTTDDTIQLPTNKSNTPLTCPICNKSFSLLSKLTLHRRTIHNIIDVTEYKCGECSSIFKHKPNLVLHIQSKHQSVKRFKCEVCSKGFFYKQAYQRHVLSVHVEKKARAASYKMSLVEELSGHIEGNRVEEYV